MRAAIGLIFFISMKCFGQNMVPNPGFEEFRNCPDNFTVKYRNELVPGWSMPTKGTADYFNSCTRNQVGVPQNFMGYCLPKEGMAYAGLILLLDPPKKPTKEKLINYREYLQTELIREMEKDKEYEITFYYSVASYSTYAINRIGVYISKEPVGNKRNSAVLNNKPQLAVDTFSINAENDVWQEFKAVYKAKGGEKIITIGNFYDDNQTSFTTCDLSGLSSVKRSRVISEQISYYYFDKFSVTERL